MGLADLRDAVEALDAGRSSAAELERSIQAALLRGVLTRNEACRALRSAASQSAAAEIIARLDLESVSPRPYVAHRLAERGDPVTQSQPRSPGIPLSERDPVSVGGQPRPKRQLWASASQNSANDRSVDPEPHAALIDGSKMIGQVLGGRYRLDSQVEGDVLGAVYRAADLAANESPFAVSMLRSEFGRFSEAMALLRAEIRVTRMLRHPHIARVYSLNSDRQGVYLVTEYLEGRTLETVLRENGTGLPLIEARRVVADMGAALAYAHDLDVVHGDLQPANVFVMQGRAKLLHFGLTRAAATRNGRFDPRRCRSQTIAYAAFEMLQGGAPDPRDDVYSFACIIYTMLSGAHPFGSRSAVEARDLALAMTPLQILSKDQNAALAQALSFEHAQRTPSVTALLAGLGWTADPPAAAAPAPASAAIPASAAAAAESTPPAAAASEQPTPPRPARRGPGLLPIPSISAIPQDLPKPPSRPKRPASPRLPRLHANRAAT